MHKIGVYTHVYNINMKLSAVTVYTCKLNLYVCFMEAYITSQRAVQAKIKYFRVLVSLTCTKFHFDLTDVRACTSYI